MDPTMGLKRDTSAYVGFDGASDRKRVRVLSEDEDQSDSGPVPRRQRPSITLPSPEEYVPTSATAVARPRASSQEMSVAKRVKRVPTYKDPESTDDDEENSDEWSLTDTTTTSRHSFTPNAAGKKLWAEETTVVQTYSSAHSSTSKKTVTTVTSHAVLTADVPKRVKREIEWEALTEQQRAGYKNDFVEYLIGMTRD